MANIRCARCNKELGSGAYYRCGDCQEFYCWDCLKKATFTTALKCPSGHDAIRRVN